MFQQLLANKHHRLRDSVPITISPSGGLRLVTDKKNNNNKSRVKQEPRSAHGRAVNKSEEASNCVSSVHQKNGLIPQKNIQKHPARMTWPGIFGPCLRLFLCMQNGSLGMCGELKRSILPSFPPSVNQM